MSALPKAPPAASPGSSAARRHLPSKRIQSPRRTSKGSAEAFTSQNEDDTAKLKTVTQENMRIMRDDEVAKVIFEACEAPGGASLPHHGPKP